MRLVADGEGVSKFHITPSKAGRTYTWTVLSKLCCLFATLLRIAQNIDMWVKEGLGANQGEPND
jgi:hypothetical protein